MGDTYHNNLILEVVVVSVPHDGGWEDWWRGGMVRYTPGGTAPPLRPSPRRPPGVVHMRWKPSVMTGSPGDGKALRGQQTWAQPLGWPLSHQVCWVVSEMVQGYHS